MSCVGLRAWDDLMALSARRESLTRDEYDDAVDSQEVAARAHHPGRDHVHGARRPPALGRALVGTDDKELTAQIGRHRSRWMRSRR